MIPLTYTKNFDLNQVITAIDSLKKEILNIPLSYENEKQHIWQALIERIYGSLYLSNEVTPKSIIADVILKNPNQPTQKEWSILALRDIFDTISYDWRACNKNLTWDQLEEYIISLNNIKLGTKLLLENKTGTTVLSYIQSSKDHSIVQAAIANAWLSLDIPYPSDRGKSARFLSYIFLARDGYDLRGLLSLENGFVIDRDVYDRALKSILNTNNLSRFILFFAQSLHSQYELLLKKLKTQNNNQILPNTILTYRQKEILKLITNPESSLSNKMVQNIFKVSQITASRELAKLAALGYLKSLGKGRSVRYLKI